MKFKTSEEEAARRTAVCKECPELVSSTTVGVVWRSCGVCGCPLLSLINLSTAKCPRGKWLASHKE